MSQRQEERAERIYRHWAPKFVAAKGRNRALLAWDYVRARVNDLPDEERSTAWEALADILVGFVDGVTDGEVRSSQVRTDSAVPRSLRGQARRVRARG